MMCCITFLGQEKSFKMGIEGTIALIFGELDISHFAGAVTVCEVIEIYFSLSTVVMDWRSVPRCIHEVLSSQNIKGRGRGRPARVGRAADGSLQELPPAWSTALNDS
ncbi:hypothetical protein CHS0354_033869 [Potamilus streckersoni]|uniref:Uncharacterized protein n=1 Tax=Potamilus streckersoni TaxID=2493646 RepID=A0AAE0RWU6_9BIVA|nr:hypothetical protein CHS0354_033869 [Potamilus streckersoni]